MRAAASNTDCPESFEFRVQRAEAKSQNQDGKGQTERQSPEQGSVEQVARTRVVEQVARTR